MPLRALPGLLAHAWRWLRRSVSDGATPRQFVRFIAVGLLNTAFGYLVFSVSVLAGVPPMPSLVLAYLLGVPFNFMTTGMFVFDDHGHTLFWRFVVAYGVIYVFNVASYHLLVAAVGAGPLVAQAICLPVVAVFAFILFKVHVFRVGAEGASGRRGGSWRSPRG
jgi:putative flippase GtrA